MDEHSICEISCDRAKCTAKISVITSRISMEYLEKLELIKN